MTTIVLSKLSREKNVSYHIPKKTELIEAIIEALTENPNYDCKDIRIYIIKKHPTWRVPKRRIQKFAKHQMKKKNSKQSTASEKSNDDQSVLSSVSRKTKNIVQNAKDIIIRRKKNEVSMDQVHVVHFPNTNVSSVLPPMIHHQNSTDEDDLLDLRQLKTPQSSMGSKENSNSNFIAFITMDKQKNDNEQIESTTSYSDEEQESFADALFFSDKNYNDYIKVPTSTITIQPTSEDKIIQKHDLNCFGKQSDSRKELSDTFILHNNDIDSSVCIDEKIIPKPDHKSFFEVDVRKLSSDFYNAVCETNDGNSMDPQDLLDSGANVRHHYLGGTYVANEKPIIGENHVSVTATPDGNNLPLNDNNFDEVKVNESIRHFQDDCNGTCVNENEIKEMKDKTILSRYAFDNQHYLISRQKNENDASGLDERYLFAYTDDNDGETVDLCQNACIIL